MSTDARPCVRLYDAKTIMAGAGAFRDAWEALGDDWACSGLSDEATSLAIGVGIAYAMTRGQHQRSSLRRSALDQVAVALFERESGLAVRRQPSHITDPQCYAAHAGELRAMADLLSDEDCRRRLMSCARDFERIASSNRLINDSIERLYPRH